MKKLYTPADESELVFLKSVLDAEGLPYYIQNENFGSIYPTTYAGILGAKTIFVPESFYEEAKNIIRSVKEDAHFQDERVKPTGSGRSPIAAILNYITLGLLFPEKPGKDDTSRF